MHLVCRPGPGRITPRNLLAVRFNETGARSTHSDSKSSHRLAKSWGDITIPSREEVLRNPHAKNIIPNTDQAKSYRPNLRYLSELEGTTTSLASRLAHKLEKPQIATSSDTPSISGTIERPVDHTIAQRRATRLAREEARRQSSERRGGSLRGPSVDPQRRSTHPRQQFDGAGKLGPRKDGHDGAMSRPNSGHGGQQFRRGSLTGSDMAGAQWSARPGSSRGSRSVAATSKAVRGGPVFARIRTVRAGEETSNNEDISLEILEEGGDDKESAEFKGPDATFADLDDVFGRLASRSHSVSPRQTEASVADSKWVQEASGGDYARFAPHSSRDFLVSHYKMSPAKHVQLVLSKRGDVSIAARHRALYIVESSMSEAGTISVRGV